MYCITSSPRPAVRSCRYTYSHGYDPPRRAAVSKQGCGSGRPVVIYNSQQTADCTAGLPTPELVCQCRGDGEGALVTMFPPCRSWRGV